MKDLFELGGILLLFTIVFTVIMLFFFILTIPLQIVSCNQSFPTLEHKFDYLAGCMVKDKNTWVPQSNYRLIK